MNNNKDFREEPKNKPVIGSNVISNSIPYLLRLFLLTLGSYFGFTVLGLIGVLNNNPSSIDIVTFTVAIISGSILFFVGNHIGSNLNDKIGIILNPVPLIGLSGLVFVLVAQFVFKDYVPSWLDTVIYGVAVLIYTVTAIVDFYRLPRKYKNDQTSAVALTIYANYACLVYFTYQLLIALNIGG
jgi:uncharacterized membrane protein SirB2